MNKERKTIHIGWYETPEEAANAYDESVIEALRNKEITFAVTNEDIKLMKERENK